MYEAVRQGESRNGGRSVQVLTKSSGRPWKIFLSTFIWIYLRSGLMSAATGFIMCRRRFSRKSPGAALRGKMPCEEMLWKAEPASAKKEKRSPPIRKGRQREYIF